MIHLISTSCELVGLLVAIIGLQASYAELFDGRAVFQDAARTALAWSKHRLGRRETKTVTATLGVAIELSATARAVVRPAEPDENAPLAAHVAYLRRRVDLLAGDLEAAREEASTAVDKLATRVSENHDHATARMDGLSAEAATLRDLAVGPNGRGLQLAAVGLGITAVGVFLSYFA